MPANNAQPQANAAQPDPNAAAAPGWFSQISRMVMMYWLMSTVMSYFKGNSGSTSSSSAPAKVAVLDAHGNEVKRPNHGNLWRQGTQFSVHVFLSPREDWEYGEADAYDAAVLGEFTYDWYGGKERTGDDESIVVDYPVAGDEFWDKHWVQLQSNETMWAHAFWVTKGSQIDDIVDQPQKVLYGKYPIARHRKLIKVAKKKNLWSGAAEETAEDEDADKDTLCCCYDQDGDGDEKVQVDDYTDPRDCRMAGFTWEEKADTEEKTPIVTHWTPHLHLRLMVDQTTFGDGAIPAQIVNNYKIHQASNQYFPPTYFDDFWVTTDQYVALNDTVSTVNLTIQYSGISLLKYQMHNQMRTQWESQEDYGLSKPGESDMMKRMLMESNPYLLAITMIVSVLHTVFDCLAFKNDIQFWNSRGEDVKGLSVRSIFVNVVCQIIIFLYLVENETSYMILFSAGLGPIIEFWKVTKAAKVTYGVDGGKWLPTWLIKAESQNLPWVLVRNKASYLESDTAKYDKEAIKYVGYALYPMLFGYCIYSFFYKEHKGWYQFVLNTAVGFVYAFGFVMMCPQLWINYRMKSVAHLPWRMLTYKFLNTIIDDLFAFLITMPTMHRLSCFRDDIVFLIFIYQKCIYRTDYERTNEYGLTPKVDADGNDIIRDEKDKAEKPAVKASTATTEAKSETAEAKTSSTEGGNIRRTIIKPKSAQKQENKENDKSDQSDAKAAEGADEGLLGEEAGATETVQGEDPTKQTGLRKRKTAKKPASETEAVT